MREKLYLAYGSNLNLRQMMYRCRTAKVVGTAEVKDHELLFRGGSCSVATIEPAAGSSVPVLLWSIRPGDEKALDIYEGYPRLYTKKELEVELDGETVTAMAYVMTEGHIAGSPSQSYLNTIAEGYRSAGFDLNVLRMALHRSIEVYRTEAVDNNYHLYKALEEMEAPEEDLLLDEADEDAQEYAHEVKRELLDNLILLPEGDHESIRNAIDRYLSAMEQGADERDISEKKEEVSAAFDAIGRRMGPFMTPLDDDILEDILAAGAEHARGVYEQQAGQHWEQMMGGI